MKNEVIKLIAAVSQENRLFTAAQRVLSEELELVVRESGPTVLFHFNNFGGIYAGRYENLANKCVANFGILESMETMKMNHGLKRTIHLETPKFNITIWTDPDFKQILGLIGVEKRCDAGSLTK